MTKMKTTSSSSKFCADFKTARVWPLILLLRVENGLFLRQGGVKNARFDKIKKRQNSRDKNSSPFIFQMKNLDARFLSIQNDDNIENENKFF